MRHRKLSKSYDRKLLRYCNNTRVTDLHNFRILVYLGQYRNFSYPLIFNFSEYGNVSEILWYLKPVSSLQRGPDVQLVPLWWKACPCQSYTSWYRARPVLGWRLDDLGALPGVAPCCRCCPWRRATTSCFLCRSRRSLSELLSVQRLWILTRLLRATASCPTCQQNDKSTWQISLMLASKNNTIKNEKSCNAEHINEIRFRNGQIIRIDSLGGDTIWTCCRSQGTD